MDIKLIKQRVKQQLSSIKPDDKIIAAVSGGVDSTVSVMAVLDVHKDITMQCVFVDHGFMREGEVEEIKKQYRVLNVPLEILDRSDLFLANIKGVSNADEKRKIIGRTFIEVFQKYCEGKGYTKLLQGTIAPDVIESGGDDAVKIKAHHNVGGLPEKLSFELLEPVRDLFKSEVRALAKDLSIPDVILKRQPFPGPGLAIRVLGEVTRERLDILRQTDKIFIDALRADKYRDDSSSTYSESYQSFAILQPYETVGTRGADQPYKEICMLRSIESTDGVTAAVSCFYGGRFLGKTARCILKEVPEIGRVVYDVTPKPPGTIEME